MDDSRTVGGDVVGASVDGAGSVVVGKGNTQTIHDEQQTGKGYVQVNVRDEQQRGQVDDTRYSILRMESKLDRLAEQVLSLTQQIPIQSQQMAQLAQQQAQMAQQQAQMAQQSAANDQRLYRLEQQSVNQQHTNAQQQQAATITPRLDAVLLLMFAAALMLLFLWNSGLRP